MDPRLLFEIELAENPVRGMMVLGPGTWHDRFGEDVIFFFRIINLLSEVSGTVPPTVLAER
jgi:hypothetical protein